MAPATGGAKMFTNLIESQSHRKEFKRRSSFFLFTVTAYALILFGAGIGSIYAYDAQLEAQTTGMELLNWVPPVPPTAKPVSEPPKTVRRSTPSSAPVDPTARVQERTVAQTTTSDPLKVPETINTAAVNIPPVTDPNFIISNRNVNPPGAALPGNSGSCANCSGTPTTVVMPDKAPEPPVVKPPTTLRVPSTILSGKAVNLPQPPYPIIAKQARVQGPVSIQI